MQATLPSHVQGVTADNRATKAFFDPETLPWLPWVMEGTWFKLLRINTMNGGYTLLLKVRAGDDAPVHGHVGAIEGMILQGGFGYGPDDRGRPGSFLFETAGIRHTPDSDAGEDMILFAVGHGPLIGYNPDGSVAAVVDARMMYEMAAAGGAAAHLERPVDWV